MGRRINTRIDLVRPEYLTNSSTQREAKFEKNDQVLVKHLVGGKKWLSGKVVRELSSTCYEICINGRLVKKYVDHLVRDNTKDRFRFGLEDEYVITDDNKPNENPNSSTENLPSTLSLEQPEAPGSPTHSSGRERPIRIRQPVDR